MERKIGEIFEFGGEWYQCVPNKECNACAFHGDEDKCCMAECTIIDRSDSTSVAFKKLEKIGEPFSCNYYGDNRMIMMQEYQLFCVNVTYCDSIPPMRFTDYKHNRIAIETKQNKEDMEEKKLNLKPFDIQKAREGKPICTRDGRKARIICFDLKDKDYPIAAAVQNKDGDESIRTYTAEGIYDKGEISGFDLMMLPEKKEGWAVIKKSDIYETEEQAKEALLDSRIGVMIRKVEWEE